MIFGVPTSDVVQGVSGGLLIAAGSSLNMLLYGRISGLSGMLETMVTQGKGFDWKAAFLAGLIAPAWVVRMFLLRSPDQVVQVGDFQFQFFDSPSQITNNVNTLGWIASGLLVGIGTKLGNGCTSGHGVCGLPRLSKRSIVAVLTFCATGFVAATALAKGYAPFLTEGGHPLLGGEAEGMYQKGVLAFLALCAVVAAGGRSPALTKERIDSFASGAMFGTGLLVSGMCRPSRVKGFLTLIPGQFDPLLMFVLGTVVCVNLATFTQILRNTKPLNALAFELPTLKDVDGRLMLGAALFGLGWGVGGICPGPGMIGFFNYSSALGLWMAAMLAGNYIGRQAVAAPAVSAKIH
ncbi:hypothetical protein DIPPA_08729 [Diplonema papillatum]|nr:hypothetical protein DIPPA_08729 [Diplonema papillatum]|eukprot:gene19185-29544_t